jgi:hypothetical protein
LLFERRFHHVRVSSADPLKAAQADMGGTSRLCP